MTLPNKTRVMRQIAPESSPESSAKSLDEKKVTEASEKATEK